MNSRSKEPDNYLAPTLRCFKAEEKPPEFEELLILVDFGEPDSEPSTWTWHGYYSEGKWYGSDLDGEGLDSFGTQELSGTIVGWIPMPRLSLK